MENLVNWILKFLRKKPEKVPEKVPKKESEFSKHKVLKDLMSEQDEIMYILSHGGKKPQIRMTSIQKYDTDAPAGERMYLEWTMSNKHEENDRNES